MLAEICMAFACAIMVYVPIAAAPNSLRRWALAHWRALNLSGWLRSLLAPRSVRLAIVRRYCDANGNYIGELYLEEAGMYGMVGVSLDSLPLDTLGERHWFDVGGYLDTGNDFLAPMTPLTVRVGAIDPRDNDTVRAMVARLPRRNMTLVVQNRFIEHALGPMR